MSLSTALLCLHAWLKTDELSSDYRILALLAVLCSVPAYAATGCYHKGESLLRGCARITAGWLLLLASLSILAFITKTGHSFSREVGLSWAISSLIAQCLAFLPLQHFSNRYHRQLQTQRPSLIIGTGSLATQLADTLARNLAVPLEGLIATRPDTSDDNLYPIIGQLEQLHEIIRERGVRRVFIAVPLEESRRVQQLHIDLLDENIDVVWVPDLGSLMLLNHSVTAIEGMPAIHLNESPLTANPSAAFAKAVMDRVIAAFALLALSPLMLTIAILVKRSSPGPIIFRQPRHGWNGQIIEVWKFRSMRMHDDQEVKQATRNDDRVTPIGRFIRRTSIDELPQLINVLQGSMSLVGPRPHAVAHNDYYTGKINAYMARHRIKPGITGLAQVSGCRGETETLDKMAKRVELDLAYINNWSVWLDLKILIKTPLTLLSKDIY